MFVSKCRSYDSNLLHLLLFLLRGWIRSILVNVHVLLERVVTAVRQVFL